MIHGDSGYFAEKIVARGGLFRLGVPRDKELWRAVTCVHEDDWIGAVDSSGESSAGRAAGPVAELITGYRIALGVLTAVSVLAVLTPFAGRGSRAGQPCSGDDTASMTTVP